MSAPAPVVFMQVKVTHLVDDVRLQDIGQVQPRRQLLRQRGFACTALRDSSLTPGHPKLGMTA